MKRYRKPVVFLLCALLVLTMGVQALERAAQRSLDRQKTRLEDALHRAAAACYASEGAYPPDVDYLRQHYGVQYEESRFVVIYQATASNLMPDITVLEQQP